MPEYSSDLSIEVSVVALSRKPSSAAILGAPGRSGYDSQTWKESRSLLDEDWGSICY
ncbi:hypothetical protein SESBI_13353 [Sesbania bispinosa]|nr:hypothetical protein SESBI_13353 [Sesbania bispinosa]